MKHKKINLTVFFLLCCLMFITCNQGKNPLASVNPAESSAVFALYVVHDNLYGVRETNIDDLSLEEIPLINDNKIVSYDWNEHHLTYSPETYDKLLERTDLWRKGFVIVANGKRIYWGLFQSWLDSYACQNPVIILTPRQEDLKHVVNPSIRIKRSFHDGQGLENEPDPRNDDRIYNALSAAEVLNK